MSPSIHTVSDNIIPFPTRHVAEIPEEDQERKWLVEHLWLASGVGILGGAPKVCKTYFAAELAVAVASGQKAFGHFPVKQQGPVLFYGAEDTLSSLKARFAGLAVARKLNLMDLPIHLLDIPVLRLDQSNDLLSLRVVIQDIAPSLLVLDPFVRMARIDENSAADVSLVLGSLREIQRLHNLAILLVHHARKTPAQNPSQALRGSSDFAAWSDTNLYITRRKKRLTLFLEHRSARAPDPFDLQLLDEPEPHLALMDKTRSTREHTDTLQQDIIQLLGRARRPMTTVELRKALCKRKEVVVQALKDLQEIKHVQRKKDGWCITETI